jgi:hypothetical protein
MLPRCVSCGATEGLLSCMKDDCRNLLCPDHRVRYRGRCRGCWDSGSIILPPWPLGAPRPDAYVDPGVI